MADRESRGNRHSKNGEKSEEQPHPGGFGRRGPGMEASGENVEDARRTLVRLWHYIVHERFWLTVIFGLVVFSTATAMAGPYLIGVAIDRYILPGDLAGLLRLVTLMAVLYVAGSATTWLRDYLMMAVSQKTVMRMRRDVFDKLQHLPLRYFDTHSHGDLMSRLANDIDNVGQVLNSGVTEVFASAITLVGTLGMMLWLSPVLTLVACTMIPVMLISTRIVARRTRVHFKNQQRSLGELNGLIEEAVSGQEVIRVFCREQAVRSDFRERNHRLRDDGILAQIYSGLIGPLMNVLNNFTFALLVGSGAWLALQGVLTIGVIASFVNYARQFIRPINQLANQFNMLQSALAGAERCFQLLDAREEVADAPNAVDPGPIRGQVGFEDVTFGYEPGTPVLKHVNLHVEPGQTIALVGPTGAGKTTIINLMMRFYELEEGRITLDGHDIREIQRGRLRSELGIVLQDTSLFEETVRENIRYGRLDADDQEVEEAALLANADSFIRRLPEGYATVLSEDGGTLSQGQRQMLSIARAILADPAILILDEATSSVDTRTERKIQQAMLNLMRGRTCFVIAHRLSTIQNADQILVLSEGEIVERGTHRQLLESDGVYSEMYTSQFRARIS